MHFFHILLRANLSPLCTCTLNFCLVFIFMPRQAGIVSETPKNLSVSGVVDTGEQFFGSVVDTGDKF
jgi:hypothetical protein